MIGDGCVGRFKKFVDYKTNSECQLIRKSSWKNFEFHDIDTKCYVTSLLLKFLAEKSQNCRFQRFLIRVRSKNITGSVILTSKSTYYTDCSGTFRSYMLCPQDVLYFWFRNLIDDSIRVLTKLSDA